MKEVNVIYELVSKKDLFFIKRYLKRGIVVSIIEPFHAFHHRKGIRFYPSPLPDFVDNLVKKGEINLLKVDQLNAREIYHFAADKAVKTVESVYPEYKKDNKDLFENVCKVLKSAKAENIFKKNLCNRLAEFYSVNILLHRIEKLLGYGQILVYPDTNVRDYRYLEILLSRSKQDYFEHLNIRFPVRMHIAAFFEDFKEYVICVSKLSAQTIASGLLRGFWNNNQKDKKSYLYGITVVSPLRQLTNNQRGPDFLINNDKILPEDVVYFPLVDLSTDQKKQLVEIPGSVCYAPNVRRCFSNFTEWQKLLRLAFKKNFFLKGEEINTACNVFFSYFKWLKVLEDIEFKHFITHCDFGVNHIGRNLALNKSGVQTWYFTDSINSGCSWKGVNEGNGVRHPFWTYLYYDHFVTWNELFVQYFKEHPGSFKQNHVVGCLWSEHVNKQDKVAGTIVFDTLKNMKDKFKVAVFDTSYTKNGWTSYAEGILFAKHFLQLVDEETDIFVFLKEKKPRNIHHLSDQVLGPKLLDLYNKMDTHPRITILPDHVKASELIYMSDLVASFPFTSTTFEALSANKRAIWHDPMGYYRNTPYGKVGGVMTHNYEELKAKVLEFKKTKPGAYQNQIPKNSPLMDPYMDGKAIDRFRELLHSPDMK